MFGFKKNEKPTLMIEAKDLMEIIKSNYDNDMFWLYDCLKGDDIWTMWSDLVNLQKPSE